MQKAKTKTRVFSGVQPTGNLHLGNYLGAITKFVALQAEHECLYCVVDLHAITVFQDPDELAKNTREVTAAFIASGIDPERHIVFNQSQVSGHAELAWIFNCVARLGWARRPPPPRAPPPPATLSSIRARSRATPSLPGFSIAWRGSAG